MGRWDTCQERNSYKVLAHDVDLPEPFGLLVEIVELQNIDYAEIIDLLSVHRRDSLIPVCGMRPGHHMRRRRRRAAAAQLPQT